MVYWNIFWRTFAQLAAAALVAVQGLDWATDDGLKSNGVALGLGLLAAFIGASAAALWAFARSPASTPLEKATRSAAQALAGAIGAVVINEAADLLVLEKVLFGAIASVILAFGITFFQNQGPASEPVMSGTEGT